MYVAAKKTSSGHNSIQTLCDADAKLMLCLSLSYKANGTYMYMYIIVVLLWVLFIPVIAHVICSKCLTKCTISCLGGKQF